MVLVVVVVLITSTLWYINTRHAAQLIPSMVSKSIPGTIQWHQQKISPFIGSFTLKNFCLFDQHSDTIITFDRFSIQMNPLSLFKGELQINALAIENPSIDLITDSSGSLNLVSAFVSVKDTTNQDSNDSKETKDPFNIALNDLSIDQAVFGFTDKGSNKLVHASGIVIAAAGNLLEQSGAVHLFCDTVKLTAKKEILVVDSLRLNASLEKGVLTPQLSLSTANSNISIIGSIDSLFTNPTIQTTIKGAVTLEEFDDLLGMSDQLSGECVFTIGCNGPVSNPNFDLHLDYARGSLLQNRVETFQLALNLHDRIALIDTLYLKLPTGSAFIRANANLQRVFPKGFLDSTNNFNELTYQLSSRFSTFALEELVWLNNILKGTVEGTLSCNGKGIDYSQLQAITSLDLQAHDFSINNIIKPCSPVLLIDASLQKGVATLDTLQLDMDSMSLSIAGVYNLLTHHVKASLHLDTTVLEQVLPLVNLDSISGSLALTVECNGPVTHPNASCVLSARNFIYGKYPLGDIDINVTNDNSGTVSLPHFALRNNQSRVTLKGIAALFKANSFTPLKEPHFDVTIDSSIISLQDFIDSLQATAYLNGQLKGSLQNMQGILSVAVDSIDLGMQHVHALSLTAKVDSSRLFLAPLRISLSPQEHLSTTGWLTQKGAYALTVKSTPISLLRIQPIDTAAKVKGSISINLSGEGSFKNPQAAGTISLDSLSLDNKPISDIMIDLSLQEQMLAIRGTLGFLVTGIYHLKDKTFQSSLLFNKTLLAPYFHLAKLNNLTGILSGEVTAQGDLDNLDKIKASVHLQSLSVKHKELPLIFTENLQAAYDQKSLRLSPIDISLLKKGRVSLSGQGELASTLNFDLHADIPLNLLSYFTDQLPDASGNCKINASLSGSQNSPNVDATITLENLGMTIPDLMQKVHGVNGQITVTPNQVTINIIEGNLDNGQFNCNGTIALDSLKPKDISLKVMAQGLPIDVPDMADVRFNTDLTIAGNDTASEVTGELTLLEGTYYKDIKINLLNGVLKKTREVKPETESDDTSSILDNISLNIDIKNRQPFLVDNNMALLEINPDLKLIGTAQRPLVNGRVSIGSGSITYLRKTFDVTKGVIDFINPYKIEPTVDIVANCNIRQWLITLNTKGTIENLQFTLNSDPQLEHEDILSLITLGKTSDEIAQGNLTANNSPEQLLAQMIDATLGEDIKKATGLDILEIDTDADTQDDSQSDRIQVTIGKELTKRLTTKYSIESLEGELTQRAIVEYKILENLLFQAYSDDKGNNGGTTRFKLEFR